MPTLTTNTTRRSPELTAVFAGEFDAANRLRFKDAKYQADRDAYITRRYQIVVETRAVRLGR
jgi:hypothetical protein